ncbi:MAG: MBL fold metallo-hydrolase [Thermoplasmatota archaeon]
MPVEQIRVGSDNFSYLVYDGRTRLAALVDPGFDASRAMEMIMNLSLDLKYLVNTHHHGDHAGDNSSVLGSTDAKLVLSSAERPDLRKRADVLVDDDQKLNLGDISLGFIHTPGHTPGSVCILVDDEFLITGDTLFIGDCGRCDLPGGSIEDMFRSLQRLKELDEGLIVLPGHDYGSIPSDSLGSQKRISNVLLARSLDEFSRL